MPPPPPVWSATFRPRTLPPAKSLPLLRRHPLPKKSPVKNQKSPQFREHFLQQVFRVDLRRNPLANGSQQTSLLPFEG